MANAEDASGKSMAAVRNGLNNLNLFIVFHSKKMILLYWAKPREQKHTKQWENNLYMLLPNRVNLRPVRLLLCRERRINVPYTGTMFSKKEQRELVIDAIAVLIGDYNITRKYAAVLILKALLPRKVMKAILEDDSVYPFDRGDPRVRTWTKQVLEKGKCEVCGSSEHLEAHHIIKWADYPKGRCDLENGQCLCHKCHTEAHVGDQSYYMMKAKES